MNYYDIIDRLCAVPSASGFEQNACDTVIKLMSELGLDTASDAMGNVYGVRKCGKPNAKAILLDAHFDEIGFIVTGHKKGFIQFGTLGGVDPRVLPARRVTILSDNPLTGVFTCLPPHLQSAEDMDAAFDIKDIYVDAGLSEDEAKKLVPVGTPMVFASDCIKMANDYICGRALDDRAGLAALLGAVESLAEDELNVDVVLCASVQEEVGCRGAQIAGYRIDPTWALAVDVTHGTTPDSGKAITFTLGSGTAIGIGPNFNRKLSDKLKKIADAKNIAHTLEVCAGESGTNAWPLQVARGGISTCLLSIPLRYMHTPCETMCLRDVDATAKLAAELVREISKEVQADA